MGKEFKKIVADGNKAGNKAKKPEKEELDRARPLKSYTVRFNFLPLAPGKDECGISVHDINFSYSGRKPWLLGPLNFRIDPSMRIAIVGPNGAGKSTLLNLVSKTTWPTDGEVCHSRKLT